MENVVRCNQFTSSRLIVLDVNPLRAIIEKDFEKKKVLWSLLSYRIIEMNKQKVQFIQGLTLDNLQKFCRMSKISIYKNTEKVDLVQGGVLLNGSLIQQFKGKESGIAYIAGTADTYMANSDETVVMHLDEQLAHTIIKG